jgi:ribonuclease HI/transposase InsO family protein
MAIKAQALADFVVECTIDNQEVGGQEIIDQEGQQGEKPTEENKEYWMLYFDGASKTKTSGAGLVLQSPEGFIVEYALKLDFQTTNNEAEYEALIAGLGLARALRVKNLKVCGDSKLVVSQVNGEFEAREMNMAKYLRIVKAAIAQFDECHVEYIPREENAKADALSQYASSEVETHSGSTYFQVLRTPTIDSKLVAPIGIRECWIDPIKAHLENGWLPGDASEARKLTVKALRYALIEGILYKKSFTIPYLRCLRPDEAKSALEEVHEGICGQHLGGRSLAHKLVRLGFYWPTMMADAKDYVKRCDRCQKHAPVVRQPPEMLTSINSPLPFAMWGMDILGPFPMATAQRKFLIVAIDYFTKWIEAKPLAKITTKQVAQFLWENVMCRYGIPRVLVTDNGLQFNNKEFRDYCEENGINLRFTSVAHPQANGQAEVANRIILDGLKKRVERSRNTWVDELLPILWAYRTTCKATTGETQFMLAYGAEAVVPVEIMHASPRVESFEPSTNEEGMKLALDLIDEVRDEAHARNVEHQKKASFYYNLRVKERYFRQGDLVLRKVEASGVGQRGKLAPNWEGPYRVKSVRGRGTYQLETLEGIEVPRTWHASNLKVYYI